MKPGLRRRSVVVTAAGRGISRAIRVEDTLISEVNKALVRRFYEEGINKRNMAVLDELPDPDYVYHGVVEGEIRGVEAMKQFLISLYAAIPDDQHMIQEQVAEGDKVVTRFKFTGTPEVQFLDIAPST
jgi:predicted ester cyclase